MEGPKAPAPSLVSKLKDHYHKRPEFKPTLQQASWLGMTWFWFYVISLIYTLQFYIIPQIWSEDPYGEWAHHIVIGAVMANVCINYLLCAISRGSHVRPDLTERAPRKTDEIRPIPYGWYMCPTCQVEAPPRAFHCKACNSCQLRRDHHSMFTGACIALANTRRFIVLCFHLALLGVVAFYYLLFHLNGDIPVFSAEFYLYVPPVPIFSWYFGTMSLPDCLLILQVYTIIGMTLLFAGLFTYMFMLALRGQTQYEMKMGIDKWRSSSWSDNLQEIFGPYWILNFFIPMPTALEIVRHWKISPEKVW